jgi:hypothetical protein
MNILSYKCNHRAEAVSYSVKPFNGHRLLPHYQNRARKLEQEFVSIASV